MLLQSILLICSVSRIMLCFVQTAFAFADLYINAQEEVVHTYRNYTACFFINKSTKQGIYTVYCYTWVYKSCHNAKHSFNLQLQPTLLSYMMRIQQSRRKAASHNVRYRLLPVAAMQRAAAAHSKSWTVLPSSRYRSTVAPRCLKLH